jgi:L-ribulose-5-phosphate 3-epimerase
MTTRRSLLASLALPAFAQRRRLRIGVTDWNLRLAGRIEAVALAAKLGFDGVEVSLGRRVVENRLPLDDAGVQEQYLDAFQRHGAAIAGTCLDVLHVNYLKSDPLALRWIEDGIRVSRALGAKVMLLPFFGKGALQTGEEMERVGDALRELAPRAEKADVLLGLENTISARDNARILDRARSAAVRVYYDVGNSTFNGHNPLEEIPWLGKDRICQFHLKDKGYLGEGVIDFPAILRLIAGIGFEGFANLETNAPSGSVEQDMARNLGYIRRIAG